MPLLAPRPRSTLRSKIITCRLVSPNNISNSFTKMNSSTSKEPKRIGPSMVTETPLFSIKLLSKDPERTELLSYKTRMVHLLLLKINYKLLYSTIFTIFLLLIILPLSLIQDRSMLTVILILKHLTKALQQPLLQMLLLIKLRLTTPISLSPTRSLPCRNFTP